MTQNPQERVNINLYFQAAVPRELLPFLILPEFSTIIVQPKLLYYFTHGEKQKPDPTSSAEICHNFSLNEVKF